MNHVKTCLMAFALIAGAAGAFTTQAKPKPLVTTNYSLPNCGGTTISQPSGCTATEGLFCYSQKVNSNPCVNFYHD